jgi:hypothetical protein
MADDSPNGVVQWWKSDDGSRRADPPSVWLKNGVGGSEGPDAARYLLSPPTISLVELNSRVGAVARERGWDPCKLSHEQRRQLIDEVMARVSRREPPEPVQPRPLTASERYAREFLDQTHGHRRGKV